MIIGLCGPAGCGKSTICSEIADILRGVICPFAAPVKTIARDQFGWDGRKDERGRRLLQVIGTEAGREYDEYIWVKKWMSEANRAIEYGMDVVSDDIRFDNEADAILELGGIVVELTGRGDYAGGHASESGISRSHITHRIDNNDSPTVVAMRIIDLAKRKIDKTVHV